MSLLLVGLLGNCDTTNFLATEEFTSLMTNFLQTNDIEYEVIIGENCNSFARGHPREEFIRFIGIGLPLIAFVPKDQYKDSSVTTAELVKSVNIFNCTVEENRVIFNSTLLSLSQISIQKFILENKTEERIKDPGYD